MRLNYYISIYTDKHQIKYKGIEDKDVMTVGYIASSNPPNYFSIKKIIAELGGTHNIHLYIASICDMLKEKDTSFSYSTGRISSLDEFYSSYDLYLNPDTFYSGLKCKNIGSSVIWCWNCVYKSCKYWDRASSGVPLIRY